MTKYKLYETVPTWRRTSGELDGAIMQIVRPVGVVSSASTALVGQGNFSDGSPMSSSKMAVPGAEYTRRFAQ